LRTIREQWSVLTHLVLSTETETQRKSRPNRKNTSHAFAYQMLHLVSHDPKMREEIHLRVQQLGRNLRDGLEKLPYSAQLSNEVVTDYLDHLTLEVHGSEPVALAPRSLQFFNYRSIQFYTKFIRHAADRRAEAGTEIIGRFLKRRDTVRAEEYERRIAMGYLLAVSDYWDLAESYCELALSIPETSPQIPRHEGHYLLALCKRIHNPTLERLRKSLHHLKRAQDLKPDGQPDPRYLTERAAVILAWLADPDACAGDTPNLQEAIDASERAIVLLQPKDGLRVTLYNNLCYWFLQEKDGQLDPTARHYAELLNTTLATIEPRRDRWPPGLLDTVLWAEFKLDPSPRPGKLRGLVQQMDRVLNTAALTEDNRHLIRSHRDAIHAALDKLG